MKDSVFEGVLSELPVNAQHVTIVVEFSYKIDDGTHKGSTERYFPSKAEATFRRATAKAAEAIKQIGNETETTLRTLKAFEADINKRLRKLEKANGSGEQQRSDPAVGNTE